MTIRLILIPLTLCAGALVAPARGAPPSEGPSLPSPVFRLDRDLSQIAIGSFGEYIVSALNVQQTMRIAAVGRQGENAWLEFATDSPLGTMCSKLFLDRHGSLITVRRVITQQQDHLPIEHQIDPAGAAELPRFTTAEGWQLVGHEMVVTGAGRFTTRHYRRRVDAATIDVWANHDVQPLGIVKLIETRGDAFVQTELLRQGRGAKSQITEAPVTREKAHAHAP